MATKHREPNRVKWIGVRPGHDGDQIILNTEAVGATVILYTVPANKVLLIYSAWLQSNSSDAARVGYIAIRDAADVALFIMLRHEYEAAGQLASTIPYPVPIEVAAGYDVYVISSSVNLDAAGGITAILIPA